MNLLKTILSAFVFNACFLSFGQREELVVHRSHSSDIELLEFSKTGKLLASLGENSEIIIWNSKLARLMTSFYIDENEDIENICFSRDEKFLLVKTRRTVFEFDIINAKLKDVGVIELHRNRNKTYYLDKEKNTELSVRKGILQKNFKGKKIPIFRCSGNSLDSKLNAFDVSPDKKNIIAAGDDGKIYLYNYSLGVGSFRYSGHNSAVKDVVFTEDGKFFASAGRDRSIILWNAETYEIEDRISSGIFRKNTVQYSEDGSVLYIGDELGIVYAMSIYGDFPKVKVKQVSKQSINNISYSDRSSSYYIATSDNRLLEKETPFTDDNIQRHTFAQYPIKHTKSILLSAMNAYQKPFAEVKNVSFSPSGAKMAFTGSGKNPSIAVHDRKKDKITNLYKPNNFDAYGNMTFIDENTIISNSKQSKAIHIWQWKGKKISYRVDNFLYRIDDFVKLSDGVIWISSIENGQFTYNINTREYKAITDIKAKKIFIRGQHMILVDYSNSVIFYNRITNKMYHTFRGHSDLVTDISFHPSNNTFVTSSFDGTVKLWDFNKKELIVSIIPFKNEDFIFITKDNYYLVSKGAINDFGFKYKDQYFYPDLFDIKYNRPDLVLTKLGSTNTELISAYNQAYKKRLKKLNFSEDKLGTDFNLPEIRLKNLLELKPNTENDYIDIVVSATDKKYNLEKLNIYLNGVAIYGIEGYDLKNEKTKKFEKNFKIPIASGKNKIEISAQNEKGVESFKQTYNVVNTSPSKGSNLFLISIGVSKYKDSKFNLNYAAKDAIDVAKAFKTNKSFNNVFNKTYTDAEVTKENLYDLKTFLKQASINDMVIVFVAGHGVLDEDFNYYFAAHDMDFTKPSLRGIPYELIENIVDNIKALRKLLFIDTCHSGEFEKDEVEKENALLEKEKSSDIIFRAAGSVDIKEKNKGGLGLKSTNELMKNLFTDLRKGTGATVISSSGGTEYAIEGEKWKNGLFTYCLLRGLENKEADLNRDKKINISELQAFIQQEVNTISKGAQTPTSRFVNTQLDYRVW
ncbi:MAG: caspase family protein [Crocinitomicaceae bacterium]